MPLHAGDRVDRYTIVELLGAGAMGEVYRAVDTKLERAVALKVLRLDNVQGSLGSDTTSAARRMLREARSVAALEHPNVVAIFDVGELVEGQGTTTFLAMELIKGKPLRAYVGDASIPLERRIRWLTDVARALGAAHAAGVVHRDVKPDNVMVRDDGVVKVLDFGIAKRTRPIDAAVAGANETMTQEGMVIGTPYYMSPEQMRGERLDGRSDQFSWGVLAYELCTGKRPWVDGGEAVQLIAQILSHVPEPADARSPQIPAAMSAAIQRALEKAPPSRFASMEDLIHAIEGTTSGLAETMPMPSVQPRSLAPGSLSAPGSLPFSSASPLAASAAMDASRTQRLPVEVTAPARPRSWRATSLIGVALALAIGAAFWGRQRASSIAPAPSASTIAPHGGCASNAECSRANRGEPWICHHDDGKCAPLESPDCTVRADPRALASEDTVWIGAMYPLTGDAAKNYGARELEGVDLARRDFAEILGGVTLATGKGHARPIALVACDDAVDAERAAHHLAEDVRAPAVIGFRVSEEVVRLAPSVFIPKGVLTLAAINASPMITSIPQPAGTPRLVWRTMYSTTQFAKPLAAFVASVLEPRVRKLGVTEPLRIAFVRVKTISELALSDALLGTLTFNGKTALFNGGSFREIVLDDPLAEGAQVDYEPAIASLLAFAPHIIVFDSGDALVKTVFLPLEARLLPSARRPLYADATPLPRAALDYVGKNAERRHRFFALTNVSTTTPNARLVTHFNETYSDKVTRTATPNSSYDAFYVLAYAALSLGEKPVDGPSLSGAIGRLVPPGKPIDVGPLGILDGFGAVTSGQSIDLNGSIGQLDFDLKTGEAPIDMAILCVGVDHTGNASEPIESGLIYDARKGELTGEMACP